MRFFKSLFVFSFFGFLFFSQNAFSMNNESQFMFQNLNPDLQNLFMKKFVLKDLLNISQVSKKINATAQVEINHILDQEIINLSNISALALEDLDEPSKDALRKQLEYFLKIKTQLKNRLLVRIKNQNLNTLDHVLKNKGNFNENYAYFASILSEPINIYLATTPAVVAALTTAKTAKFKGNFNFILNEAPQKVAETAIQSEWYAARYAIRPLTYLAAHIAGISNVYDADFDIKFTSSFWAHTDAYYTSRISSDFKEMKKKADSNTDISVAYAAASLKNKKFVYDHVLKQLKIILPLLSFLDMNSLAIITYDLSELLSLNLILENSDFFEEIYNTAYESLNDSNVEIDQIDKLFKELLDEKNKLSNNSFINVFKKYSLESKKLILTLKGIE